MSKIVTYNSSPNIPRLLKFVCTKNISNIQLGCAMSSKCFFFLLDIYNFGDSCCNSSCKRRDPALSQFFFRWDPDRWTGLFMNDLLALLVDVVYGISQNDCYGNKKRRKSFQKFKIQIHDYKIEQKS